MSKELSIQEPLKELETSKAEQIKKVFEPMVKMLESFEEEYSQVMSLEVSEDNCLKAKDLNSRIARVRIEAEKVKTKQKKQYLIAGNAIQSVYNILLNAVNEKETLLKERANYYKIIEAKRIEDLSIARGEELAKYGVTEVSLNLGNMEEALYNALRDGSIAKFQAARDLEARLEKERVEREEKEVVYNNRLKALLIYGDLFDHSLLTVDSTEKEFEKIMFDTKALKVAFDKKAKEQVEEQVEENQILKKEAEKAEKKRLADKKKADDEKAASDKKLKEAQDKADILEKEKEEVIAEQEAEKKRKSESSDKEKLVDISTYLASKTDTVKSEKAKDAIRKAYVQITDIIKSL